MDRIKKLWLVSLIVACLLVMSLSITVDAARYHHRHNPEAGKAKAAKRIGIGTAIGAGAGGLIGGRKGALVGAGLGAAGGTAYHFHKKHQWRRHHHTWRRRHVA